MYRCTAKEIQGKEITPKAIGKIRKGDFYIPACPYYIPRVNIPKKIKASEVFAGWHCHNCKNLEVS